MLTASSDDRFDTALCGAQHEAIMLHQGLSPEGNSMSAFIVSDKHLDAIIGFAVDHKASYYFKPNNSRTDITSKNANEIGQILLNENYRSVNHRYREGDKAPAYKFKRPTQRYTAVDILKAISCLDYQSCETDDWSESHAWAVLDGIKDYAIRALPGYEASCGWSL